MNDLRLEDQARVRRALRFMDDEAPLAPGISELGSPAIETRPEALRAKSLWVAVGVFVVTLLVVAPIAVLLRDGPESPPLGVPGPPTETTTTTVAPVTSLERLPLDGRPGDLGVESLDFLGAMFPTSPQEQRMSGVWAAVRHNVELAWVESCMEARGFTVEMPRVLAVDVRRNGDMPDFELDAEFGFFGSGTTEYSVPTPPDGATAEEASAWNDAFTECNVEGEVKRSEQFDQVMGQAPSWFELVGEVNTSPDMRVVTDQMLECIADKGGPEVDSVIDLYSDQISQEADSVDEAIEAGHELAELIYRCAGDYEIVRAEMLRPIRDQITVEYADVLAEAEKYYDEVLAEVGMIDSGE